MIPGLRERRCDDPLEEEFGNAIVCVPKKAELVPALLKLRNMLRYIVVFYCGGIHEHAEMGGQDKVGCRLMHQLQTEPHMVGCWASIGVDSLQGSNVACDEQLGKCVVIAPVLCAHQIVLRVQAGNLAKDILLDFE